MMMATVEKNQCFTLTESATFYIYFPCTARGLHAQESNMSNIKSTHTHKNNILSLRPRSRIISTKSGSIQQQERTLSLETTRGKRQDGSEERIKSLGGDGQIMAWGQIRVTFYNLSYHMYNLTSRTIVSHFWWMEVKSHMIVLDWGRIKNTRH